MASPRNVMEEAVTSPKKLFSTVLAARGTDGRPSDLEFHMRSHCDKVRVVGRLAGRAHLLIPKIPECSTSLAVRAYYACDLQDVQRSLEQLKHGKSALPKNQQDHGDDDFDRLENFLATFQCAVVLFVLEAKQDQRSQLDDTSSFFHRAQRIAKSLKLTNTTALNNERAANANGDKLSRVLLVPDNAIAISSIVSVVKAIQKRKIRQEYFDQQRVRFYLPDPTTGAIPKSSEPAAAAHIAEALRMWADRFDLPTGEASVLMSMLGTLGGIATSAGDGKRKLEELPVDDRTKRLLGVFFGYTDNSGDPAQYQSPTTATTLPTAVVNNSDASIPRHYKAPAAPSILRWDQHSPHRDLRSPKEESPQYPAGEPHHQHQSTLPRSLAPATLPSSVPSHDASYPSNHPTVLQSPPPLPVMTRPSHALQLPPQNQEDFYSGTASVPNIHTGSYFVTVDNGSMYQNHAPRQQPHAQQSFPQPLVSGVHDPYLSNSATNMYSFPPEAGMVTRNAHYCPPPQYGQVPSTIYQHHTRTMVQGQQFHQGRHGTAPW